MLVQGDFPGHHPVHALPDVLRVSDVLQPQVKVLPRSGHRVDDLLPHRLPALRACPAGEALGPLDGVLDFMHQRVLRGAAQALVQNDVLAVEGSSRPLRQAREPQARLAQLGIVLIKLVMAHEVRQPQGLLLLRPASAVSLFQQLPQLVLLVHGNASVDELPLQLPEAGILRPVFPPQVSPPAVLHAAVVDFKTPFSVRAGVPAGLPEDGVHGHALPLHLLGVVQRIQICSVGVPPAEAVPPPAAVLLLLGGIHHLVKGYALDVDILPVVGYTAHRTTSLQFDRHLEAYRPKQRNGSIFIRMKNITVLHIPDRIAVFGVSAGDFLHIVDGQAVFHRAQVQNGQHRLPILRPHGSEENQAGVLLPAPAHVPALQHQHRVVQDFGNTLDFRQGHLRVLLQDGVHLLAAQVDVLLHGPQALQHVPGGTQDEHLSVRPALGVPFVDVPLVVLVDAVLLQHLLSGKALFLHDGVQGRVELLLGDAPGGVVLP